MKRYAVILWAMMMATSFAKAQQVEVSAGMLTSSKFEDSDHNGYGKGSMQQYSIKYTKQLSMLLSEDKRPIAWSATFAGSYNRLGGSGMATQNNPGEIVNASLTVSHLRPISARWSIMTSLGAGICSAPNDICWSSVLFNGACLFVYKVCPTLNLGGGVGLINAYGAPMVVPMAYLRWTTGGKTSLDLTFVNGIKAVAAHNEGTTVSVGEELEFVRAYCYLEQMRFGDCLNISIGTAALYAEHRLLPASVQMLIENAIKHNVVSNRNPLRIAVTISREGVAVENEVCLRSNVERHGIGLSNLRQMVAMMGQQLRIEADGKTFRVLLPYI